MSAESSSGVTYGNAPAVLSLQRSTFAPLSSTEQTAQKIERAISSVPLNPITKYTKDRYPQINKILLDLTELPKELCQMIVNFTDAMETSLFYQEKPLFSTYYPLARGAEILPDGALWPFIVKTSSDRERPEFTDKELTQCVNELADSRKTQSMKQLFAICFDFHEEGPRGVKQLKVSFTDVLSNQHLHALCRMGSVELVQLALSTKPELFSLNHYSSAYQSKNLDLVKFFDKNFTIQLSEYDYFNGTIFEIIASAAKTRSLEIFFHAYEKFIKAFKKDINSFDLYRKTIAHYVASDGSAEMLREINKLGGDFTLKSLGNNSILHSAAFNPDVSVLAYLCSNHLNLLRFLDEKNGQNDSPLSFAVSFGNVDPVQFLVDKGATISDKILKDSERYRTRGPNSEIIYNFLLEHRGKQNG
jgi:hypothetical protein